VLATAYLRDDRILDHALPTTIPVIPNRLYALKLGSAPR
jgi:hypothetical protein